MQGDGEKFERWFVKPLRDLESLPEGDGAFIALATSCYLYERYAKAIVIEKTGKGFDKKLTLQERNERLTEDFAIDKDTAVAFWNVIRNGLLHHGMPKVPKGTKRAPKCRFHHSYPKAITLCQHSDGKWWLEVQPWKFMDRVIELCQSNLELITTFPGVPWATIES
jgi:hypothetical protein